MKCSFLIYPQNFVLKMMTNSLKIEPLGSAGFRLPALSPRKVSLTGFADAKVRRRMKKIVWKFFVEVSNYLFIEFKSYDE